MPKQKTHKGSLKRMRVTRKGKVLRKQSFRGHLLSGKSGRRKLRLRRTVEVTGRIADRIREALRAL